MKNYNCPIGGPCGHWDLEPPGAGYCKILGRFPILVKQKDLLFIYMDTCPFQKKKIRPPQEQTAPSIYSGDYAKRKLNILLNLPCHQRKEGIIAMLKDLDKGAW